MTRAVFVSISKPLYDKIIAEKRRLQEKERQKIKSRRRKITMMIATKSIARKL